jgi:hypothetical protein
MPGVGLFFNHLLGEYFLKGVTFTSSSSSLYSNFAFLPHFLLDWPVQYVAPFD